MEGRFTTVCDGLRRLLQNQWRLGLHEKGLILPSRPVLADYKTGRQAEMVRASPYSDAERQTFLMPFRIYSTRFSDIEAWQVPNCRALFCFMLLTYYPQKFPLTNQL